MISDDDKRKYHRNTKCCKVSIERYYVDFYDMTDGWGCFGFFTDRLFDDLGGARKLCDELNSKLPEGNKKCGEHYGVMDSIIQREVYCGQDKKYKEDIGKMANTLVDIIAASKRHDIVEKGNKEDIEKKGNKDNKDIKIDWSALEEHWKDDYDDLYAPK